jgi:hypothetical protein
VFNDRVRDLQTLFTSSLGQTVSATVETETCPTWLLRPGRTECAAAWPAISLIYTQLTGLTLPLQAPSRERRRLDIVLTYPDGDRQILEVDERQHFTAARATTLEHYPPGTPLGFDSAAWLTRSRTGRTRTRRRLRHTAPSAVPRTRRPTPPTRIPRHLGRPSAARTRLAPHHPDQRP